MNARFATALDTDLSAAFGIIVLSFRALTTEQRAVGTSLGLNRLPHQIASYPKDASRTANGRNQMTAERVTGAFEDAAGRVQDAVGGLTGDAATQAKGKLHQAAGKAKGLYGQAADQAQNVYSGTISRVQDNPVAALLIAAGVGYVLARLLHRDD